MAIVYIISLFLTITSLSVCYPPGHVFQGCYDLEEVERFNELAECKKKQYSVFGKVEGLFGSAAVSRNFSMVCNSLDKDSNCTDDYSTFKCFPEQLKFFRSIDEALKKAVNYMCENKYANLAKFIDGGAPSCYTKGSGSNFADDCFGNLNAGNMFGNQLFCAIVDSLSKCLKNKLDRCKQDVRDVFDGYISIYKQELHCEEKTK
ncbi:uncharacterized protein LOC143250584 [Tachypleus tridentatus]|uniref:uncharacterized protein LOC143250584 n=1 Tax=Tachypleus tridentatus TaxID=6853 RepID=UPI003FD00257